MLSIVIPCYNESKTLAHCVERLLALKNFPFSFEIIIVDDGSNDGSYEIALSVASRHKVVRVLRHDRNRGKGAALRTGFGAATGEFVAIQDADLEYDPLELPALMVPLLDNRADVVYGSRFLYRLRGFAPYWRHAAANRFLTSFSNIMTGLSLSDMETCYKVFRSSVLLQITIEENKFGFEPEITAKVAHLNYSIYEVPITYRGRTYKEGKKIGLKDGVRAIYCIFRYNLGFIPRSTQVILYNIVGCFSEVLNILSFFALTAIGWPLLPSAILSFAAAVPLHYFLCVALVFGRRSRWFAPSGFLAYLLIAATALICDTGITMWLYTASLSPVVCKSFAALFRSTINFFASRYFLQNSPAGKSTQSR